MSTLGGAEAKLWVIHRDVHMSTERYLLAIQKTTTRSYEVMTKCIVVHPCGNCVCVCWWRLHVCAHVHIGTFTYVCIHKLRPEGHGQCLLQSLSTLRLQTVCLMDLELTILARLTGQEAPGVPLSLPFPCSTRLQTATAILSFYVSAQDQNSVSSHSSAASTIPTEPSSRPWNCIFMKFILTKWENIKGKDVAKWSVKQIASCDDVSDLQKCFLAWIHPWMYPLKHWWWGWRDG